MASLSRGRMLWNSRLVGIHRDHLQVQFQQYQVMSHFIVQIPRKTFPFFFVNFGHIHRSVMPAASRRNQRGLSRRFAVC